jgi:hypothetical protein
MNKLRLTLAVICVVGTAPTKGAFINLDFEAGTLVVTDQSFIVQAAPALPGWSALFNGTPRTTIAYNTHAISLWDVSIHDAASIYGKISGTFSVALQGGVSGPGPGGSTMGYGAIAQNGTVPSDARSVLFSANIGGPLEVSVMGEVLPFVGLASQPNYTTYGVDVTRFAGQSGELRFSAPFGGFGRLVMIDDIRFSTQVVPEPTTSALACAGLGILLSLKRCWDRR